MTSGDGAQVVFDVVVKNPLPSNVTQVANQAFLRRQHSHHAQRRSGHRCGATPPSRLCWRGNFSGQQRRRTVGGRGQQRRPVAATRCAITWC
ncbi:MAG: hypothetical protein R3A10_18830 [Caldilineaceae bacterium]